ncbi:SDR family NAD(P)-dependent oxidoreductase [Pseudactinotalea suaedae]|uniref:SDR family NAD(P)-dependent oxidoreductase n=1 Tax=Pseudactinotalea suaedae TaxID=1524924 RepID=UPI0012E28BE0|nr:SDR family oxidoreductase [Pseudactinotalea suaedae]
MQVKGKVFVVTGGGNGIGRAVVLELLRRGARVAAVDLRGEGLAETAALAAAGDRLSTHAVDVTDRDAVERLPELVTRAHGTIDGLLNVAGVIQKFVPFSELGYPEMERVVAVNLWGVVNTCHAFLPVLLERPRASIVNVSSMGGLAPVPGQTMYGASKAAVKLFSEGLYAEMQGTNVAVTTVFPGGVATGIAENSGASRPGQAERAGETASTLTTAASAASQIVDGIEKGAFRIVVGRDATMVDRLSRLAPRKAVEMIASRMKSLTAH